MAKYGRKFKLKIVKEYLEGTIGYFSLANKHGIPAESQLGDGFVLIKNLARTDYVESILNKFTLSNLS